MPAVSIGVDEGHPVAGEPSLVERPAVNYAVKGLGLVGVAILSGLLWVAFQPSLVVGTPTTPPGVPAYQFQAHAEHRDTDCRKRAYGVVAEFLSSSKCQQVARSLHTTSTADGAKVVVSISVVRMADSKSAVELNQLASRDKTGNITDLLRDGYTVPDGPRKLTGAGYASTVTGSVVTIVESDFFTEGRADLDLLKAISTDALRFGAIMS
ncbi:hypothetical protein [Crossiella sp. S99.1]|uniref:hypothetical protein n=1 Tax=Crossiella sp. S99.1 TaxID=2936271 RepID=UPI001FFEC823|nr:hypothetical protein [Crossiella sp. S99.1]MCK2254390.1 hypothetical protein [Crossiella sp. S99.1]